MTTPTTSSPLPPDRGSVATERRNPRSERLDELDTLAIVRLINDEDATIAASVRRAEREIAAFAELAAEALGAGGRLIYLGAGTSGRLGVLDASECPPTFQMDPSRVVGVIAGGDAALRQSSESREDERDGRTASSTRWAWARATRCSGSPRAGRRRTCWRDRIREVAGRTHGVAGVHADCAVGERGRGDRRRDRARGGDGVDADEGGDGDQAGAQHDLDRGDGALGKTYGNLMVDLRATNDKLRDRAARIVGELTGLGRGEAFELLGRAGGSVKVAAVMHWCGLDRSGAEARLGEAGGVLRLARRG
ncbi:MAG: hypothetical protein R3B49_11150 [Phycisphaerales bacterium]